MAEHHYDIYTPQGEGSLAVKLISGFLVLLLTLVSFQIYRVWKNPYSYSKEVYNSALQAYKLFPEGEKFYKTAVESSIQVYKFKSKLINSYGYEGDLNLLLKVLNTPRGEGFKFLGNLITASFAKWLIVLGILIGIIHKTLIGFLALLTITLLFVVWKSLKSLEWLKLNLKAWKLAKFKDKDILNVIKVLLANPRPASLYHHESGENGLLKHSLAVASLATEKAKAENVKDVYLAGLLHDIGKIKLYTQTDKGTWVSTGAKQEVVNKLTLQELKEKFGIREITDPKIWKIVKSADREVTLKELWETFKGYLWETDIKELLKKLIPKTSYIYLEKENLIAVPAKEINTILTEKLNELFPDLNFKEDEVDYFTGVHPIAFAKPYRPFVVLKFQDLLADELDLFDLKVKDKLIKAVYLFDNSKFNLELKPFNGSWEILERKTIREDFPKPPTQT